jgi:hypothetical protein
VKVGRNERCLCESDLEHKHCHGSPVVGRQRIVSIIGRAGDQALAVEMECRGRAIGGLALPSHQHP